jgi:hypothetical protein
MQPKVRSEKQRICPTYKQHCKHTQSTLHLPHTSVCMTVSLSVNMGVGYQESCPITPNLYLPAPPWKETRMGMIPKLGGSH